MYRNNRNSIRQADELVEIGDPEPALEILHNVIVNARHKNIFNATTQDVMIKFVKLGVQFQHWGILRHGLRNYLNISLKNPSSLSSICGILLNEIDSYYSASKAKMEIDYEKDLVVFNSINIDDQNIDVTSMDEVQLRRHNHHCAMVLHDSFINRGSENHRKHAFVIKYLGQWQRFYFRMYKIILEINRLPTHVKIFTKIALRGLEFFKSENLESEFSNLFKEIRFQSSSLSTSDTLNSEIITKHILIHKNVIQHCLSVGWLQEGFGAIEEIHSLFTLAKSKRIPISLILRIELCLLLSKFFKSTSSSPQSLKINQDLDHLAHAACLFAHISLTFSLFKQQNKGGPLTDEQVQKMKTFAEPAFLAVCSSINREPTLLNSTIEFPSIHPIQLFNNSKRVSLLAELSETPVDRFRRTDLVSEFSKRGFIQFVPESLRPLQKLGNKPHISIAKKISPIFEHVTDPHYVNNLKSVVANIVILSVAKYFDRIDQSSLQNRIPFYTKEQIHSHILYICSLNLAQFYLLKSGQYLVSHQINTPIAEHSNLVSHLQQSPFEYNPDLTTSISRFASSIANSVYIAGLVEAPEIERFSFQLIDESESLKKSSIASKIAVQNHQNLVSVIAEQTILAAKEEQDQIDAELAYARQLEIIRQEKAAKAAAIAAEKDAEVESAIQFVKSKAAEGLENADEVVQRLKNIKALDVKTIQEQVLDIKTEIQAQSLLKQRQELKKYREGVSYKERARREIEADLLDNALKKRFKDEKTLISQRTKQFYSQQSTHHRELLQLKSRLEFLKPLAAGFDQVMKDHQKQLWETERDAKMQKIIKMLSEKMYKRIVARKKFEYAITFRQKYETERMARIQARADKQQLSAMSFDWKRGEQVHQKSQRPGSGPAPEFVRNGPRIQQKQRPSDPAPVFSRNGPREAQTTKPKTSKYTPPFKASSGSTPAFTRNRTPAKQQTPPSKTSGGYTPPFSRSSPSTTPAFTRNRSPQQQKPVKTEPEKNPVKSSGKYVPAFKRNASPKNTPSSSAFTRNGPRKSQKR